MLCAAGACAIALPLGVVLAVLLFKTDVPGRRAATLLVVGMLFVPLYLVTGAWDAGFGVQGWHTLTTNPHLLHRALARRLAGGDLDSWSGSGAVGVC